MSIQPEEQLRTVTSVVKSAKMDKTLVVVVQRYVAHKKYKKYHRLNSLFYVHDEKNEAGEGDVVEIVSISPRSKKKSWGLVRILTKSK